MIVLVHNILPPYRVSLFNEIATQAADPFCVLLARDTHPKSRSWRVPWEAVRFDHRILPGWHVDRRVSVDLSFQVSSTLNELNPSVVVVAGWGLPACWAALAWCRRHHIPAVAWAETSSASVARRGSIHNLARRRFLGACQGAVVPGQLARRFVEDLAPGLDTTEMPNSVDADDLRTLAPASESGSALFLGELSERKGFDLVLEAAPRLLDLQNSLVIAGVGKLGSAVQALVDADSRVTWLGFVEGAARRRAIESAAVVLLPSRRDPWPLAAAEAIVAGRPLVLGPGVGSAPDLARLGAFVGVMKAPKSDDLVNTTIATVGQRVTEKARCSFSPAESAQAFLVAVDRARR